MCIGVPMRIESGDALTAVAVAERAGGARERHTLDMLIVGAQPAGTWVLEFQGAARRVLDPIEAQQMRDALQALQLVLAAGGETADAQTAAAIEHLFADLVERTPQLPEHLRTR